VSVQSVGDFLSDHLVAGGLGHGVPFHLNLTFPVPGSASYLPQLFLIASV
jgi:hypothetical protein